MVDPINRFLEHPDPQTRLHIIDLFGTQKVLEVAQLGSDRISALRVLYQQQLQEYAYNKLLRINLLSECK